MNKLCFLSQRYHRSLKNVVKPEYYYFSWGLEKAIADCIEHCIHGRYHGSLDKVTPAHMCNGLKKQYS